VRPLFLPKCSPDLIPIGQDFAKLKAFPRKVTARTGDANSDAIAEILTRLPPKERAAYLRNSGYAQSQ